MKGDKKTRWFFRIRDAYLARSAVLMVKRNRKPSVGPDGVARAWVITLTAEISLDPKYRVLWASDEEAAPLLEMLEEECGKLKTTQFVPLAAVTHDNQLPKEF